MPRQYKRHTDMGLVPGEAMLEAVELVINGEGMSIRKVAKDKGISKSALARYVKKYQADKNCKLAPNYKHSQIFNPVQEADLAKYLTKCSQMFHGLTPKNTRKLAYEIAVQNNMRIPEKWHENQMAGCDWMSGFLKRHSELSIRNPEATSLARATSFKRHNINAYFDLLEQTIKDGQFTGRHIFNLDETGFTTVQKVPKVIAKKGSKQVGQVTSQERGQLVTVCGIVGATGIALPPVFVFPRKNFRDIMLH
ncbi:hypothetical protein HOLleu_41073 [Holothuria leucospilota]|uniref:HTH psq-type domain-containing protein n=1 Tax=Holothuria leucospilota TaxID=206669 RepID=A0A9Q1B9G8_HOLLE|nr:hypothetical protein HOLleu_41073 [Holothuria leucospilota]